MDDFKIIDDNTADWAVRTIKAEEAERDRLISIAHSTQGAQSHFTVHWY